MPTDTKKSTAKASCSGSALAAALWLSSDSLNTMPAKKAPSAKETPKSTAAPIGDAERDRQDAERKQLARSRPRHLTQHPGHHARADQQRDRDERRHLGQREAKGHDQSLATRRMRIGDHLAPERFGERRQQHQDQDHGQILDDQPADGDAAVDRGEGVAFLQRLQQDHGTGDRQAEAQHHPRPHAPAPRQREAEADAGGDHDLADGAQHHHAPHGHADRPRRNAGQRRTSAA